MPSPNAKNLNLPKQLIAVDSTTVTVGENRLKWAKFKGKKSGIKLHVALNINDFTPQKVVETIAKKHDGPIGESLIDVNSILVEDRAYGNHERFDMFKEIKLFCYKNKKQYNTFTIKEIKKSCSRKFFCNSRYYVLFRNKH